MSHDDFDTAIEEIEQLRGALKLARARLAEFEARPPCVDARAICGDARACAAALSTWIMFATDHPDDAAARETASYVAGVAAGYLMREAERAERAARGVTP